MTTSADVLIVGAGAAGLFCAGVAAQRGLHVVLLDHAPKVAEKIRISGGGRSNFTNRDIDVRQPHRHYLGENPAFCRSALSRYTPADFIALMQQHGVPFHEKHKGQLFCNRSSQDLIDLLLQECQAGAAGGRVDHWQPCGLKALRFHDQADAHYEADTDRGTLRVQAVVVATGGLSIPQIGASDLGYRLARQFNLDMVPTRPALVPLTFDPSLYVIDGLLPVPMARLVASFAADHAWAYVILAVVYNALFATFAAIIVLDRRAGAHPGKFVSLVLLIGLAGFLLYFIAPGTSPLTAFYEPNGGVLPDPAQVDLARFAAPFTAPRNAMPSLHTTYALVMLMAAARFGVGWLAVAGLFALITILATMGLREHYVIDLVVAVPLALATTWFLAAFDRESPTARFLARAGIAFAIVLAWLLVVRFGTPSLREVPWLASGLVLATLAAAAAIGVPRRLPAKA